MKTKIAICVILPLMLVACVTTNIKYVPITEMPAKQQVALGWVAYNKIYDDYKMLSALPDPSDNEKAVMAWEYEIIKKAWPILIEASKMVDANLPLKQGAIDMILSLRDKVKEVRF